MARALLGRLERNAQALVPAGMAGTHFCHGRTLPVIPSTSEGSHQDSRNQAASATTDAWMVDMRLLAGGVTSCD
jgi:hypothetical protein